MNPQGLCIYSTTDRFARPIITAKENDVCSGKLKGSRQHLIKPFLFICSFLETPAYVPNRHGVNGNILSFFFEPIVISSITEEMVSLQEWCD